MTISLDEDVVRSAVASALVDQLGSNGQRVLVAAALEFLVTPQKDRFNSRNDGPSPLQNAFNNAVGQEAAKIVQKIVAEDDEFREKITRQVGEAFLKMEATDFTDYLGTALSQALRNR